MIYPTTPITLSITLRTSAVELIGFGYEPQFVNPLTFVVNQLAGEGDDWNLFPRARLGQTSTSFKYKNGVEVNANFDALHFEYTPDSAIDTDGPVESIDIARRYIRAYGVPQCRSVVYGFQGTVDAVGGSEIDLGDKLSGQSLFKERVDQNGNPVLIRGGVLQSSDMRNLQTDVYQTTETHSGHLEFASFVQHDFLPIDREPLVDKVESILSLWASDWSDVEASVNDLVYSIQTLQGEHVGYR